MKVIIAGSRDFHDWAEVLEAIRLSGFACQITQVVSGKAQGVDTIGEMIAERAGWSVQEFPYLKQYGKAGGPIRNRQMAIYADALIAVWDGESPGTLNMIQEMAKWNKPTYVHRVKTK